MTATIRIGYNKRCWANFEVKDITEEEASILAREGGDDGVTDLLRTLDANERLIFQDEDGDDNPTYVQEWDEPVVIAFESAPA